VASAMGLTTRAVYGKLKKYRMSASEFKKRWITKAIKITRGNARQSFMKENLLIYPLN